MSRNNPYAGHQDEYHSIQNQPNLADRPLSKSEDPVLGAGDEGLLAQARTAFVSKVYSLLTLELLITFSLCLVSQYSETFRNFQLDNAIFIIIPVVLLIIVMIIAFCVKKARRAPFDIILLLVFILSFSYIVSMCCSAVVNSTEDGYPIVPVAIAGTVAITLALTLYAFFCKGHYLIWLGILFICLSAAFVLGITAIFVRLPALYFVICGLGIIIYGIYLVIITKMIIDNSLGGFPLDSAIIASVFLYMYIMRIFLYVVAILGGGRR